MTVFDPVLTPGDATPSGWQKVLEVARVTELVVPDVEAAVRDVTEDLPPLVPFADAAARLGVDRTTLRRWVSAGRLAVLKTDPARSGRVLVPRTELARLVRLLISVAG